MYWSKSAIFLAVESSPWPATHTKVLKLPTGHKSDTLFSAPSLLAAIDNYGVIVAAGCTTLWLCDVDP